MNAPDPSNMLIAGVYFILAGVITLFSIFGVYVLMRYAKSTLLAFTIAVFYSVVFLGLLSQSYATLQSILQ